MGKHNDSVMVRITWGGRAYRAVLLPEYADRNSNGDFNWNQEGTEIEQSPGSPADNDSVAVLRDDC